MTKWLMMMRSRVRRALPRILMIFRPGKGNRVNWSTWTMKESFNDGKGLEFEGNPKDFKVGDINS